MNEQEALNYPLARAFALKNFVIESNPWGRVIYETDGYIGQEARVTIVADVSNPSSKINND